MQNWPDRLEQMLWDPRPGDHRVTRAAVRLLQLAWALVRDLLGGQLTLRAMGLVYVTIMSLVPACAIGLVVLQAFGVHRELEPMLRAWFAPLGAQAATITAGIIGFVDNIQGNVLAGLGLVLLFITTLSMAQRVEGALNFIWRVDRSRSVARRLSDYLSAMLVGPVVMVTALGLIASIENNAFVRQAAGLPPVGGMLTAIDAAAPYLLVCGAFSFVYWFMPNTRVHWAPALLGGLLGGILWAGTGSLFAHFVVTSARTLSIYSTFAIVILALVWVYLCWLILLVGAQLAFYIQNPGYLPRGYRPLCFGSRFPELAALAIMVAASRAHRGGGPRPTAGSLAGDLGVPAAVLAPVLARLEAAGLLTGAGDGGLAPSRDPDRILVRSVLAAARSVQAGDVDAAGPGGPLPPPWLEPAQGVMGEVDAAVARHLGDATLGGLAARVEGDGIR